MYKSEILADSLSPQGNRLTTFKVTFPRIVLSEFNTHRVFSRNSASSRAIPFEKMVKMVEENPFIPIAWQKDHKGMQGTEYITFEDRIWYNKTQWLRARDAAIEIATDLNDMSVTKQLCNRLLEPFMWHTVIITSSEEGLENFFKLRCPQYFDGKQHYKSRKDYLKINDPNKAKTYSEEYFRAINDSQADIHIQAIAELMWDSYNESEPKLLDSGQWHIPNLGHKWDEKELANICFSQDEKLKEVYDFSKPVIDLKIKIATAHCAKISYNNFGTKIDYEKDIILHDNLLKSKHMSPFEHCARAMSNKEYNNYIIIENNKAYPGRCRNFTGFIQYRSMIDG
jgi:hypothetical protein